MAFPAGSTLTTTNGAWTNSGAVVIDDNDTPITTSSGDIIVDGFATGLEDLTYQWKLAEDDSGTGAANISLATAQQYASLEEQDGSYIGVDVTLHNGADSATEPSLWSLLGTMYSVGETLRSDTGTWTNLGAIDNVDGVPTLTASNTVTVNGGSAPSGTEAISWQWYRADDDSGTNVAAIAGATSREYTLASADINKYIAIGVTINNGVDEAEQLSAYIGDVADDTPPFTIQIIMHHYRSLVG